MTDNDKKKLFGGKNCIVAFFAKRKAIKRLDSLIEEADNILETYESVTFDNALETAFKKTNPLFLKETYWANDVEIALKNIFGGQLSDIAKAISNVVVINELHLYAQTRSKLEQKRDLLITFRNEIKDL